MRQMKVFSWVPRVTRQMEVFTLGSLELRNKWRSSPGVPKATRHNRQMKVFTSDPKCHEINESLLLEILEP